MKKMLDNGKLVELTPEEIAALEAERKAYEASPEYKQTQIDMLKAELSKTDYKAIKYAEGWITAEEYEPIKAERQALRDKINALEAAL